MSTPQSPQPSPEWRLKKFKPQELEPLEGMGFSRTMQKALAALGLSSHDEVQDFLVPPMSAWTGGAPFPSLKNSVEEIWTVVQTHQPVCIHGDFDTDGLCAMTVLRKGLEVLGIEVFGHLPRREQGHGVSIESFAEVLSLGAKSVITVDCGISANEVGELAAEKGIPFIVTDHHLPDEELPKAVAIVNPQLDPHDGNSQQLCGAGVALKLVLELAQKAPEHKSHSTEFRDYFRHAVLLSAIATIGDVMPLTGDNRALVQRALPLIPEIQWPGLRALLSFLKMNEKTRAEDLAFQLIPRLNSAQRLERGDLLKSLLACSDEAEGKGIVEEMNQLNLKRREMQEEFSQIAMARAAEMSDMKGLVWVEGDEWLEGFSGLMASRLVQTYGRPAAVVKNVGDEWQASCRAPEGYHLKDALDEQSELLLGYGGHAQAAGFRVKAENAQALKEKMNLHFTELKPEGGSLGKLLILDEVPFAGIHEGLLAEIQKLEPFGHGHRRPLLATKGLVIDGQPRLMGPKKNHVSFRVFQAGQSSIEAIGFGLASELMALDQFGKVDLVYHLGRSPYSNAIQLQVQAVRQHKAPVLHRR